MFEWRLRACYRISMPSEVHEIEIQAGELRLAARRWGASDGAPVLALHGWLDNAASFDRLIPLLPEGLQIVAVDLPGHGRSQHRGADAYYLFVEWVPIVFAIADALGWKRFSLLGHSMGAGISTLCAGTLPERIERMVLIEGLGPHSSPPADAPALLAKRLAEQSRLHQMRPRLYKSLELAIEVRRQQPNAQLEAHSARLIVERGVVAEADGYRWTFDARLRAGSLTRLCEASVIAFIERIACPTLLIIAKGGWPFPAELVNRRVAALANGQVLELPGSHHLHLDTPEVVADPIGRFLVAG